MYTYILGISRLKGTTLYELYLTHQQRGLNWRNSKEKSDKDVLSAFKVCKCDNTLNVIKYLRSVYNCIVGNSPFSN